MEATLKFLIIIMLFFVILNSGIIDYIKKKFKLNEPFSKTTNIVLLGDNFFDNNNYTYYNEAISQFLLGKRYTTKILSENNATASSDAVSVSIKYLFFILYKGYQK